MQYLNKSYAITIQNGNIVQILINGRIAQDKFREEMHCGMWIIL